MAALHYGGMTYELSGGNQGALKLLSDIRQVTSAGGGGVTAKASTGQVHIFVSPTIPVAVVMDEE